MARSLCLDCGLCCTGTLFSHGKLNADEFTPNRQAKWQTAGVKLRKVDGHWQFDLPCGAYAEHRCQCYTHRPHICADFHCHLLQQYEASQIERESALATIQRTQDHIQTLATALVGTPNDNPEAAFHERLQLFRVWYAAQSKAAREPYAHLMVKQRALLMTFEIHFYPRTHFIS